MQPGTPVRLWRKLAVAGLKEEVRVMLLILYSKLNNIIMKKNIIFYGVLIYIMFSSCNNNNEKKNDCNCSLYLGYKFISLLEAPPTRLPDTIEIDISKNKCQLIIHTCEGDADLYIFKHGKKEFVGSYLKSNILDSIYIETQQLSKLYFEDPGKYVPMTYPYMDGCWKFNKFLDVYNMRKIEPVLETTDNSFIKTDTIKNKKSKKNKYKKKVSEKKSNTFTDPFIEN